MYTDEKIKPEPPVVQSLSHKPKCKRVVIKRDLLSLQEPVRLTEVLL